MEYGGSVWRVAPLPKHTCIKCDKPATYDSPNSLCDEHWAEWWGSLDDSGRMEADGKLYQELEAVREAYEGVKDAITGLSDHAVVALMQSAIDIRDKRITELEEQLRWRKWDEEPPELNELVLVSGGVHATAIVNTGSPTGATYWRPLDLPEKS
jgi:hypothetical protein